MYFEISQKKFSVNLPKETLFSDIRFLSGKLGFKEVIKDDTSNCISFRSSKQNPFGRFFKGIPNLIKCEVIEELRGNNQLVLRTCLKGRFVISIFAVLSLIGIMSILAIASYNSISVDTISAIHKGVIRAYIVLPMVLLFFLLNVYIVMVSSKFTKWEMLVSDYFQKNYPDAKPLDLGGKSHSLSISALLLVLLWAGAAITVSFSPKLLHANKILLVVVFFAVLFVVILLVLAYLMLRKQEFNVRFTLALVGIVTLLPLAFFYNTPLFLELVPKDVHNLNQLIIEYEDAFYYDKTLKNDEAFVANYREARALQKNLNLMITNLILSILGITFGVSLAYLFVGSQIERYIRNFKHVSIGSVYHKALLPFSHFNLFGGFVIIIWIFLTLSVWMGSLTTVCITCRILFGGSFSLLNGLVDNFLRIVDFQYMSFFRALSSKSYMSLFRYVIATLYIMPFWLFIGVIIWSKTKCISKKRKFELKTSKLIKENNKFIQEESLRLSEYLRIPMPAILKIKTKRVFAATDFWLVTYRGKIYISEGAMNHLNRNQISGLLAHEMWHIKRHGLKWVLLSLSSEVTLFGKGFLANTMNSYRLEKEADEFAANWVGNTEEIISLLKIQRAVSAAYEIPNLKFSSIVENIGESGETMDADERSKGSPFKRSLKTLLSLYLTDEIASYIHPSYDERIAWLKDYRTKKL